MWTQYVERESSARSHQPQRDIELARSSKHSLRDARTAGRNELRRGRKQLSILELGMITTTGQKSIKIPWRRGIRRAWSCRTRSPRSSPGRRGREAAAASSRDRRRSRRRKWTTWRRRSPRRSRSRRGVGASRGRRASGSPSALEAGFQRARFCGAAMDSRGRVPRGGEGDSEIGGNRERPREIAKKSRCSWKRKDPDRCCCCSGFIRTWDLPHAAWQVGGFSHFGFALSVPRSHGPIPTDGRPGGARRVAIGGEGVAMSHFTYRNEGIAAVHSAPRMRVLDAPERTRGLINSILSKWIVSRSRLSSSRADNL